MLSPSPRLIREGKFLSMIAGSCLAATLAVDAVAIGAMAVRSADTGMSNGGFAFLIRLGWLGMMEGPDPTFVPIDHFTVPQSVLATMLLTARLIPGLVVLWNLARLFGMYGRGEVFTERNTRYVRTIAWALIGYAIVPVVTHATLFLASMSPVLWKWEARQLDAASAGLVVLALARVVSFGCALDEERRGFV